ncbi:MAG TPA: hypothetical protein VGP47_11470 [Parachlamydiaceae bacterium]|nr:hypothetical protein [Parachlamydiaceae bacterium]
MTSPVSGKPIDNSQYTTNIEKNATNGILPKEKSIAEKMKAAGCASTILNGANAESFKLPVNTLRSLIADTAKLPQNKDKLQPHELTLLKSGPFTSEGPRARKNLGIQNDDKIFLNTQQNDSPINMENKQTKSAFHVYTKLLDKLINDDNKNKLGDNG